MNIQGKLNYYTINNCIRVLFHCRTKNTRWTFVLYKLFEIMLTLLFYNYLLEEFFVPSYRNFGLQKITWIEFLLLIVANSIVGILILLSAFYMFFHCWLNMFAEILQFGDRLFYDDWWNSTTPKEFINKWNIIMNNWLYTYIYKDIYVHIESISKNTAKFIVFVFSAITHEIHLWFTLQFAFPALLFQYVVFGLITSFFGGCNNRPIPKLAFWFGVAFGTGHIISLYTMEMMLRINHPRPKSVIDLIIPRLLNTALYIE